MMLNKLSLNTIGLNRIGLNRIGKPSRGSSVRPYIDPEVLASLKAVCICYGKSNDDLDRAIVKNLVDPDNPFIISNAAHKLNSGYGKYEVDFTKWSKRNVVTSNNDNSFSFESKASSSLLYYSTTIGVDTPSFKIKANISNCLVYYYYINDKGTLSSISIIESGEFELPISHNTLYNGNIGIGFEIGRINGTGTGTITQIPSYQGAFVTDGVNDLVMSTKTVQEMLGGSNEITAISMIGYIDSTYDARINFAGRAFGNTFLNNRIKQASGKGKTYIVGYTKTKSTAISTIDIPLGDKEECSSAIGEDSTINKTFSVAGFIKEDNTAEYNSVAWYWTIIANKVLTTDQINQVIAYYNLDRCVEPTVLYDVKRQGLSNDTPDSDWYLKDYSDNGYDMTLYNYAKIPESGINEGGGLQSDGVEDYGKVTGLPIYKDYTVVADREIETINGGVLSKSYVADNGSFIFEQYHLEQDSTSSFGYTKLPIDNLNRDRKISYQSKYSYNGTSLSVGTGIDGSNMWLATIRDNDSGFSNIAIYSLMTFPYSMSEFLIERQLKKHKLGTLYPDMVELRPIIKGGSIFKYLRVSDNKTLYPGDYINVGDTIRFYVSDISGTLNEVSKFTVNGIEGTPKGNNGDLFDVVVTKSPQKIDITIDEYIRYEDIVQPYPEMWVITQNAKKVSWGDKLKVGSEFGYNSKVNLLSGLYSTANSYYNGKVVKTGDVLKVEKQMVFACDYSWIGGTNEPKCILSPSRLRIPNSSYKILGYIPDLSGNRNHGKINNSAYAEGSGVNADGSYQLDGVDDFITIPTLSSGGKQVLMKVNWQSSIGQGMLYDQRGTAFAIWNSDKYNDDETDTIPAYSARNGGNTYIDGILNKNILASQLRNITHNIVATNTMLNGSSVSPTIGCRTEHDAYFTNMSLYDFMLFDEISTDEEILTLNKYIGIEGNVWGTLTELSNSTLISNETLIKNE